MCWCRFVRDGSRPRARRSATSEAQKTKSVTRFPRAARKQNSCALHARRQTRASQHGTAYPCTQAGVDCFGVSFVFKSNYMMQGEQFSSCQSSHAHCLTSATPCRATKWDASAATVLPWQRASWRTGCRSAIWQQPLLFFSSCTAMTLLGCLRVFGVQPAWGSRQSSMACWPHSQVRCH